MSEICLSVYLGFSFSYHALEVIVVLVFLPLLHAVLAQGLHEEILRGDGTQCHKPTPSAEQTTDILCQLCSCWLAPQMCHQIWFVLGDQPKQPFFQAVFFFKKRKSCLFPARAFHFHQYFMAPRILLYEYLNMQYIKRKNRPSAFKQQQQKKLF